MSERKLKPYLTNIADAIRSKMYNPNLYDAESYPMTAGKYINTSNGVAYESIYYAYTNDYIPCTELCGKFIAINHVSGNVAGIAFYDTDKKYISGVAGDITKQIKTTIPETASYYRFCVLVEYIDMAKVEEGDTATEYTPFGYRPLINAQDFPEKVAELYDKGVSDKESKFWDDYTNYGQRTSYQYAFMNWEGFEYIRPKYKVIPTSSIPYLFYGCRWLQKVEPEYFDLSQASVGNSANTAANYLTFAYCNRLTEIEDIGLPDGGYYQTYLHCYALKKIAVWRINENCALNAPFTRCDALEDITIDGTIGGSISWQYSPLNVASMKSIITALKDYSGTDKEFTYTLTLSGECRATLEAEGNTSPNGNTWNQYVFDKGWTLA